MTSLILKARCGVENTEQRKVFFLITFILHALLALFTLMGCSSSMITSTAVHQPVLLGDVGRLTSSGHGQKVDIFYIHTGTSECSEGGPPWHPLNGNTYKADAELQKRIATKKDKIIIEKINLGYQYIIIPAICVGWVCESDSMDLDGAILKAGQNDKANALAEGETN
jgi:hypothetical protein